MERSFSDPVRVQEAPRDDTPGKYVPKKSRRDVILVVTGALLGALTVILAIVAVIV